MKAVIALGSNMGHREDTLKEAMIRMERQCGTIVCRSSMIETRAYGYTDQADFMNMVLLLETMMEPLDLLHALQSIEKELGRVRTIHWGPRTIDLDIIFFEDRVIDHPELRVPHPDFRNRDFVLIPAAEILPDYLDPETGLTLQELLRNLPSPEAHQEPSGS